MEGSPDHGVGRVRGLETRAVPRPGAFPAQGPDAAPFSPSTTPRGQTSPLSAAQPLPLRLGNHRGTLHLLRTVEREVVVPQAAIFPYFPAIWEYHAGSSRRPPPVVGTPTPLGPTSTGFVLRPGQAPCWCGTARIVRHVPPPRRVLRVPSARLTLLRCRNDLAPKRPWSQSGRPSDDVRGEPDSRPATPKPLSRPCRFSLPPSVTS